MLLFSAKSLTACSSKGEIIWFWLIKKPFSDIIELFSEIKKYLILTLKYNLGHQKGKYKIIPLPFLILSYVELPDYLQLVKAKRK